MDKRWNEIRDARHPEKYWFPAILGSFLIAVLVWIGLQTYAEELQPNLYTEVISVLVTVFILELRNEYRNERNLKRLLARMAGSRANEVAISAIDWIRHEHWLDGTDKILEHAELEKANLANSALWCGELSAAYMPSANLSNSECWGANFTGANLIGANLSDGVFWQTDFSCADMWNADFTRATLNEAKFHGTDARLAIFKDADMRDVDAEHAHLVFVDLTNANLLGSNFKGVDLRDANLEGAILEEKNDFQEVFELLGTVSQSIFDEKTILPDGSYWTSKTDLKRFTDRSHQQFWRSKHPMSPAYVEPQ